MKKILIPVDGTERAMISLGFVRETFAPSEAEILLLHVDEEVMAVQSMTPVVLEAEFEGAKNRAGALLERCAEELPGYTVVQLASYGDAGTQIVGMAKSNRVDTIVMTKSTRTGWAKIIGSVCAKVVKNAPCLVMIVPEETEEEAEG